MITSKRSAACAFPTSIILIFTSYPHGLFLICFSITLQIIKVPLFRPPDEKYNYLSPCCVWRNKPCCVWRNNLSISSTSCREETSLQLPRHSLWNFTFIQIHSRVSYGSAPLTKHFRSSSFTDFIDAHPSCSFSNSSSYDHSQQRRHTQTETGSFFAFLVYLSYSYKPLKSSLWSKLETLYDLWVRCNY